jgi:hypothetical protein
VTAPTPFNLKVFSKFHFYHCLEEKILLKIKIQMAVKLYLYFGLENQRTNEASLTFDGGSLSSFIR